MPRMELHWFTDTVTSDVVTMERHPGRFWREIHRRPTRLKWILNKLRAARDRVMDAVKKGALDL